MPSNLRDGDCAGEAERCRRDVGSGCGHRESWGGLRNYAQVRLMFRTAEV